MSFQQYPSDDKHTCIRKLLTFDTGALTPTQRHAAKIGTLLLNVKMAY